MRNVFTERDDTYHPDKEICYSWWLKKFNCDKQDCIRFRVNGWDSSIAWLRAPDGGLYEYSMTPYSGSFSEFELGDDLRERVQLATEQLKQEKIYLVTQTDAQQYVTGERELLEFSDKKLTADKDSFFKNCVCGYDELDTFIEIQPELAIDIALIKIGENL